MVDRAPSPLPDFGVGPVPEPGDLQILAPGVRRLTAPNPGLMTGPGTNTYLLGDGALAVVDPGPDDPLHRDRIVAAAVELGATIRWVIVTHTHPDHAPGANRLAKTVDAEVIGYGPGPDFEPDREAADGFVLDGPGFTLRAVHTPGHASDHLCWLHEQWATLLTGDHVMDGSTVVIRPPDGGITAYLESLDKVVALAPARLAPGHGRVIGNPAATVRSLVAHRLFREEIVADALASAGEATVESLLPLVYADVSQQQLAVARFSLWAHLQRLAEFGRAIGLNGEDDSVDMRWGATPTTRPRGKAQ